MQNVITPNQLIVETMEAFGEAEPQEVLVIYTAEDGSIRYRCTVASRAMQLGMMELVKAFIVNGAMADSK